MKATEVRALAERHDLATLEAAVEAISEREEDVLGVEGADLGEKLTHLLLASRVRVRVDAGEALKDAFRAEMASVRDVMSNG